MLKLKSFILLIYCFVLCFIGAVKAEMSKPVSWAYQHGSCGNRIDVIDSTAEGACAQMATTILCPHPFIKPVYTSTGINPEPYSGRGTCKYSYIIPDAIMPGIVPPQIYKGSSGNIQVDGYVSRYFCPPQKMPTTRDEFLSMENTSRLLSELQECPKSCPVEPLKPITDPDAKYMEDVDPVRKDKLTPNMKNKLPCLEAITKKSSVTFRVNSAWRPQSYQDHFRDIFDKMTALDDPKNQKNPSCIPIRKDIEKDCAGHAIAVTQPGGRRPVAKNSNHAKGDAFDASWDSSDTQIDSLAAQCGLCRPHKVKGKKGYDRPHFEDISRCGG